MVRMTMVGVVVAVLVAPGCRRDKGAEMPGDEDLWKRAAFDTGCAREELQFVRLSDDTVGVTGCGRKLVYIQDCHPQAAWDCKWVLNSDEEPADLD
jgi:hypothetical protein